MSILNDISSFLQQGRAPKVKELVAQALEDGIPAQEILEQGLLDGMSIVGEKFKNNEVFVPEVLIAARAMNMGTQILRPHLVEAGVEEKGTVVIGTVKGDLQPALPGQGDELGEGRGAAAPPLVLPGDGQPPQIQNPLGAILVNHHEAHQGIPLIDGKGVGVVVLIV